MNFDLLLQSLNIAPANLHNALRALPDFVSILVIIKDDRVILGNGAKFKVQILSWPLTYWLRLEINRVPHWIMRKKKKKCFQPPPSTHPSSPSLPPPPHLYGIHPCYIFSANKILWTGGQCWPWPFTPRPCVQVFTHIWLHYHRSDQSWPWPLTNAKQPTSISRRTSCKIWKWLGKS